MFVFSLVDGFKDGSNALAAADAHGDEGILPADPTQFVQRFDSDNCAGGPKRVPQGDAAAVGVCFLRRQVELASNRQYLRGEGFVPAGPGPIPITPGSTPATA